MRATNPAPRHDRLALRLSVIISRLFAGESLSLKALSGEFGVSERTLRRDFSQRLLHLDLTDDNGCWRLRTNPMRDHTHGALAFARNTGIARLIPSQSRHLMQLLMDENGTSPCLIGHAQQPAGSSRTALSDLLKAFTTTVWSACWLRGFVTTTLSPTG